MGTTDLLTSAARLTRMAGLGAGCSSPVALRPRVAPGLPLSASLQAGTAFAVLETVGVRAPLVHLPTCPIGASYLGRRTLRPGPLIDRSPPRDSTDPRSHSRCGGPGARRRARTISADHEGLDIAGHRAVDSVDRPISVERPTNMAAIGLEVHGHGLRHRRTTPGGLHLQRDLPVLDRRGSRRRDVRLGARLAPRRRRDRGHGRHRSHRRAVRPHPRQRARGQLEGRRLRRRRRVRGAAGRAAQGLHRAARRRHRRPGRPHRRGRLGRAGPDHVHASSRARAS